VTLLIDPYEGAVAVVILDELRETSDHANFGRDRLRLCVVATLTTTDLPGRADCAWVSPPCQDPSSPRRRGVDLAAE
jgi:hypothetical protein